MLIIHSVKEKTIKNEPVHLSRCMHCGKNNTLDILVKRKYFTLFWIPIFPLRKKFIVQCSECLQVTEEKKLDSNTFQQAKKVTRFTRAPVWMWTGTLLISFFIFMVSIAISQHRAQVKAFAEHPQVGDIYVVRNNPKYYFMKIIRIEKNNIYMVSSKMVVKLKDIDDINLNSDEAFYDKEFIVHRKVLWKMYEDDRVYEIIRN